ncbi:uncharacterized protein LOC117782629 isoform X2 [Drosophila innubila]|uniref:uncharacterized protein LOC117782629 isoform X2 n=1 Tax=Drosophila innubila TaxID=198719 RepID=UPI00148E0840|nr:uncharacterized protein LOC117782629 isoform X2 [Drosophila innubila]
MRRANYVLSLIGLCLLGLKLGNATNSNDNGPGVALTRQAVELGMEPSVLGELWRTKQPVIISKPDAVGQLCTTTYELSPDGQNIIATTVKDGQSAAKLEVTTTTPSPVSPQTDWEYLPNSIGHRRTFTITPLASNWPSFGEGSPQFGTGHNNRGWPSFEFPAGVTPQTSTKTEQDNQGRTVTTTIKTYRSPVYSSWSTGTPLGSNWPSFEIPAGVTPKVSTKTELDDQGRTVTTTTKTYEGAVSNNWTPGGEAGSLPSSWQQRPNIFEGQLPSWLNRPPLLLPLPTRPTVQQPLPTPVAGLGQTTPKTIATFNVNDLPTYTNTNELPTNTRVTTYRGTFNGVAPPKAADLEPPVRAMLNNAGITDEDILYAQARGEDIVRNRVMPDGSIIKTTVHLDNRAVGSPEAPLPTPPPRPLAQTQTHQTQPAVESQHESQAAGQQRDKSIEDFLSQVNLRPDDILAQNGEVVKTIVDKDGRVLSAKFVLSTVKGDEQAEGQGQAELPTK